jgi:uncharacterized protein (TIGR02391 family)
MSNLEVINLLQEQINKIPELRKRPAYSPQYRIWNDRTETILQENLENNFLKLYKSCHQHRISRNDEDQHRLYLEVLAEKEEMLNGFVGELKRDSEGQRVQMKRTINFETYDFHPEIKKVSQTLFEKKEYASAVLEAFKSVINKVKEISNVRDEKSDESLMGKVFTPDGPIIRLNNLSNVSEKDEQRGFMNIFKGIVGLRNLKAHENVILNDPFKAIEYLSLASLLCRVLDERVK